MSPRTDARISTFLKENLQRLRKAAGYSQERVGSAIGLSEDGRRTIYYQRKAPTPTQRVGIAHALAHLVWDFDNSSRQCYEPRWPRVTAPHHVERRADLFAGELLAPLVELDRAIPGPLVARDPVGRAELADQVDRVASRFQVPPGFLRWRLWDLSQLRRSNFCVPPPANDVDQLGRSC